MLEDSLRILHKMVKKRRFNTKGQKPEFCEYIENVAEQEALEFVIKYVLTENQYRRM